MNVNEQLMKELEKLNVNEKMKKKKKNMNDDLYYLIGIFMRIMKKKKMIKMNSGFVVIIIKELVIFDYFIKLILKFYQNLESDIVLIVMILILFIMIIIKQIFLNHIFMLFAAKCVELY